MIINEYIIDIKPGGSTPVEKKNRYERLRVDCVEKGWICHVITIEVGCRGFLGHSVISFLSKVWKLPQIVFRPRRNVHQVGFGRKREVFSMKEIHAEPPFPCDDVRNGYCKRVITSTAESKRIFKKIPNCTPKMKINVQCSHCS